MDCGAAFQAADGGWTARATHFKMFSQMQVSLQTIRRIAEPSLQ
jgi:hypothetical protein